MRDDENLRRLVLGARRELATNDLGDRECSVAGADADAAELDVFASPRTRQRQRGCGFAALDDRELG